MTGGGDLGVWSGDLAAEFKEGLLKDLRGNVSNSQMLIENNKLLKSKVQLTTLDQKVLVDLRVQQMSLYKGSPILQILQPLIDEKTQAQETVDASGFSVRLQTESLKNLSWKNMTVDFGKSSLRSDGGYDEKGMLSGQITVYRGGGGKSEKWEISGHRDQPSLLRK
jgi:hypothetical protein